MPLRAAGRLARPVSASVSVFDERQAVRVRGSRERERRAPTAPRIPRSAHEHAHALAHATGTREPRGPLRSSEDRHARSLS